MHCVPARKYTGKEWPSDLQPLPRGHDASKCWPNGVRVVSPGLLLPGGNCVATALSARINVRWIFCE